MKKIRKFYGALAFVAMTSFGLGLYNQATAKVVTDDVTLDNVEAFTSSDVLNCEYHNNPRECVITISADMKLEILGFAFATPNGDGSIKIDGGVVCSANGDESCRPIDCIELYKVIRDGSY